MPTDPGGLVKMQSLGVNQGKLRLLHNKLSTDTAGWRTTLGITDTEVWGHAGAAGLGSSCHLSIQQTLGKLLNVV